MQTTHTFDNAIAQKTGVPEAILYQWLNEQVRLAFLYDRQDHFYIDVWWSKLTKKVEENVFPFWTHKEIDRFIQNLLSKGYIKTLRAISGEDGTWIELSKSDTSTAKKKRGEKVEAPANPSSEPLNYMKTDENGMTTLIESTIGATVNELIDGFKHINPSYVQFFARKVERVALENLIRTTSVDMLFKLVATIPHTNKMQFAPVITRPSELERNYSKLIAFIQRTQSKSETGGILF